MRLIEEAVDVLKDYLSANMAAKLNELDTEYGDFELEDVQGWYIAELSAIPEYPSVIILGDRTDIDGGGDEFQRYSHIIMIACLASDADAERLRRRLYRYIRAVAELIRAGEASFDYITILKQFEYSPLYTRGGAFLGDSRIIFTLDHYQ